jgi:hypothetical protein
MLCLMAPRIAVSAPLSLPWGAQVSKHFQEIEGFSYFYGDAIWGSITFLGHFDEMEAEIQLTLTNRYIVKALLILGPGGINGFNCLSRYKKIIALMNKKYGHFYFRKSKEDPTIEELLYSSHCRPFMLGMRKLITYWKFPNFLISATLWGDEEDAFIEIEYVYTPLLQQLKKNMTKKLLNKL